MNYTIYIASVASFFISTYVFSSPILSFYYKSALDPDRIQQKIRKSGKIGRYTVNGLAMYPHHSGIFSTYGGYLQTSDAHGQTIFPRLQHDPALYVIITNKLTPIVMFENTISHWELVPGTPTAIYYLERHYSEENHEFFWQVNPAELSEYPKVPMESVIIFAKPHNIVMHTDYQPTEADPHLMLPDLYILKEINVLSSALYILNIKHLFRPVTFAYQVQGQRYEEIPNP